MTGAVAGLDCHPTRGGALRVPRRDLDRPRSPLRGGPSAQHNRATDAFGSRGRSLDGDRPTRRFGRSTAPERNGTTLTACIGVGG